MRPAFFIPVHRGLPPAFAARAFRCAIHSAAPIVSDFVSKIAPLKTAQTIDMTGFLPISIQLRKAELDEDLLAFGQLHPFDQAHQQLPAGKG